MESRWTITGITRAMGPLLAVLVLVEIGSGLVLGQFEYRLLEMPTLLVLVPVTIGTAGNLGSILASRLSTALALGTVGPERGGAWLAGSSIATVALATTLFPIVGLCAWGLAVLTADPTLALRTVLVIATTSGLVLAGVAIAVTTVTTWIAWHASLDPDSVVIPVVTNVCDVLGVVVLFGVVELLL
ncbi:magnesium transporter [Halococcoides cellulosivorans]|uniref:ABC transporter permease n=1 Tax=Halococcoides cellulosivorans TaxID=1679096 RepID=A0A2R4X2N3_9EURY|nr:magnesium transporter [Halococcoides cellulosivorans]AWB28034.1 ABC transporter permease [Halococcoides cellulosivorans]